MEREVTSKTEGPGEQISPQAEVSGTLFSYGQIQIQLHYEAEGKSLAELLKGYFMRQRRG